MIALCGGIDPCLRGLAVRLEKASTRIMCEIPSSFFHPSLATDVSQWCSSLVFPVLSVERYEKAEVVPASSWASFIAHTPAHT